MDKTFLLKSAKLLFVTNLIFWIILSTWYFMTKDSATVKLLLILEPFTFAVGLYGLLKKNRYIYYFSIGFTLINSVLSVTDQMGVLDIISFILSFLLFINLLSLRSLFYRGKNEKDEK